MTLSPIKPDEIIALCFSSIDTVRRNLIAAEQRLAVLDHEGEKTRHIRYETTLLRSILDRLETGQDYPSEPFKRSDILQYLNALYNYSVEMIGGMEIAAMQDQGAEVFANHEIKELGEMGLDSIRTVRNDLLESFCEAVNEAYREVQHEDHRWLSMGRVYNMARQFADGGQIC